jgi:predicted DNA-binding WGR domain protein
MVQQGQVFPLTSEHGGETRWAYRYRVGGRGSRRVQRGGFATEQAAVEALERALEPLRRKRGFVETEKAESARVPGFGRRSLRPAQLPQSVLMAGSGGGRDRAAKKQRLSRRELQAL